MALEHYLQLQPVAEYRANSEPQAPEPRDPVLENLVHGKSGILSKKLEILAAEMWWRLHLASGNLKALDEDQVALKDTLNRLDRAAHYQIREHQEKAPLYRKLFEIESEKRSQQIDCWRDVVMVMRDFLTVWEAHEHARSRSRFIEDVGARTAGYL